MSDNILALTNQKKNEIEFELEVDGLTVARHNHHASSGGIDQINDFNHMFRTVIAN